jgi:hypothetical protein
MSAFGGIAEPARCPLTTLSEMSAYDPYESCAAKLPFTRVPKYEEEGTMATQDSPSLYERLGGVYSIATVVDDFVDRIMIDPLTL